MTKSKTPTAATPVLGIDEISARLAQLRQQANRLNAEQIELERAGAEDSPPRPAIDIDALVSQLESGGALSAPTMDAGSRLFTIKAQRVAVDRAIESLNRHLPALIEARAAREYERRGPEWRENLRQRALTIARLQRLNREAEQLEKEIRRGAMMILPGSFATARIGGLGYAPAGADFRAFLEKQIQVGVTTPSEIAKERGDTKDLY